MLRVTRIAHWSGDSLKSDMFFFDLAVDCVMASKNSKRTGSCLYC